MKVYVAEVYSVYNYSICAVADSAENCKKAIVAEYKKQFGSFKSNGFKNEAEWLKYHDVESCIDEVEMNTAWLT